MKIIMERPPNWELIATILPAVRTRHGIIFAYGDTCFNPDGIDVTPGLVRHESVHMARQSANHKTPDEWWERYLKEPLFRFDEELPAHVAEYHHERDGLPFLERKKVLREIARKLASPIYGHLVTAGEAEGLLVNS